MGDSYSSIHAIEKQIERIKILNKLGKVSHDEAKKRIRTLEKELAAVVRKLPAYERNVYKIRKEFGKEF